MSYELGKLCVEIENPIEALKDDRIKNLEHGSRRERSRASREIEVIEASLQRKLINYLGENKIGIFTEAHWKNKKPGWGKTKDVALGNCRDYIRARLNFPKVRPEKGSEEWMKEIEVVKKILFTYKILTKLNLMNCILNPQQSKPTTF